MVAVSLGGFTQAFGEKFTQQVLARIACFVFLDTSGSGLCSPEHLKANHAF